MKELKYYLRREMSIDKKDCGIINLIKMISYREFEQFV